MSSLGQHIHTRRAPKLKQRNLRRKNKGDISIEIGSDSGGGSLRRPPSEEISPRNRNSSSTMKRLCRLLMMLTCISIMIYIIIILYQRGLINTKVKSDIIGLRASSSNNNDSATTMKDAKG